MIERSGLFDGRRSRILVTCPNRVSAILAREIRDVGLESAQELAAGVVTEGTMADAMRLNLEVRTGHRVLWMLREFEAADPDEMYANITKLPWEDVLDADGYLSVISSVDTPSIDNTQYANVRCKDAIVDRMVRKVGRRPDSGPLTDRAVVFLYWKGDHCGVFMDTSGEPLSNRGYRRIPWKAPMRESLAAAVVMTTNWTSEENFVNPMCGSGTLAIEAALYGLGRAPGLTRSNFGFMHLKGFPAEAWKAIRAESRRRSARSLDGRIVASDVDPDAVTAARRNAATAGVDHVIEFAVGDFRRVPLPPGGGIILLNPEYGARMGDERRLESTYSAIGDYFKTQGSGYTGYIFTGNLHLARQVGLRTKRRVPFFNGSIDCRLLEYELYEGSRRRTGAEFGSPQ